MKSNNDLEHLKPYLDFYQKHRADSAMSPEFVLVLRWFIAQSGEIQIENNVYDSLRFLKKIQRYIDEAKQQCPEIQLDIEMFDIFECVRDNLKAKGVAYGLQVAKIMQSNINLFKDQHPDKMVDANCRTLFCYLAHTQPQLTAFNAILAADLMQKKLDVYLKSTYRPRLNLYKIKYILWVATAYPNLQPNKAMRWVDSIASSKLYRKVGELFPPSYPFSYIGFTSNIDGTASFEIYAKTILSAPFLFSLLSIPNSRKGYLDKGVMVEFNLHETDTPVGLVATVKSLMSTIETTLIPRDESAEIFHKSKWKIIDAAKDFCDDFADNFPGLTFIQMQPPKDDEVKESDDAGKKMRSLIDELNYTELARMLATGLSANHRQWGISMLEQIAYLPSYQIYLLCGELKDKHIDDLYKSYDNMQKHASNPHKVIIGKQSSGYYVHWCMANNGCKLIMSQAIKANIDIQYLDTLTDPYFKKDASFRSTSSVNQIDRLKKIILPLVQTSLEIQRKDHADRILKIVNMLIEYGADPGERHHPDHPGSQTVIEKLIDKAHGLKSFDSLNRKFLCDMVKLLHFADRGRSHLWVESTYAKHFLGKTILLGEEAKSQAGKSPLQLQSVSSLQSFIGNFLEIKNYQNECAYLLTMPLEHFTEDQQIIDICTEVFPSSKHLTKEEFEASIKRKLRPSKEIGVIDVLYSKTTGKIIGFNIAVIVFPKKPELPLLHYIRLAACKVLVQTHFRELMSQISFQRVMSLKKFFSGNILTCYTAVSAMSYLQVAKLPQIFPKHDCISLRDLHYFLDVFFAESEILVNQGLVQCPSRLYYHVAERETEFFNESDVNCKAYNTRYDKPGFGTLVAFYDSRENLQKLAGKIKSQLAGKDTFFSIAEKAHEMNAAALRFRQKL